MRNRFKDIEREFEQLKKKFRLQEISREEFVRGLERLRLKDDEGRFWMIGAKSGKWYYFDGVEWIQSEPPSILEKRAICIHCGFDNDLEAEVCVRCGVSLEEDKSGYENANHKTGQASAESSDSSGERIRKVRRSKRAFFEKGQANFILRSVNPLSFLFFSAVTGLLLGIIIGAIIGASNFSFGLTKIFPSFFQEVRGNLLGGISYAVLGGALGLLAFSFFGFLTAFFANLISSLVGGIKVHMDGIDKID